MEIAGLPLHPLVVHAVVVLAPLGALVALGYAFVPRWRWLLRWPLVVIAVLLAGASIVAASAGEALAESRGLESAALEDHEELGELMRTWSLGFVVDAVLAAYALGGPSPLASGRGARESRGWVGVVAVYLLVAGGVGLAVVAALAGDSGARMVWGG